VEVEWLGHVDCMWHEMCTGLSEVLNCNDQSTLFKGLLCICIPSYRHSDISVAVTDNTIHSLTSLHSYCSNTINISTVVMLGFWLCQFNAGSLVWELCLILWTEFVVWLF
jgi:hypothetical protein